jgi:hypothetical protein
MSTALVAQEGSSLRRSKTNFWGFVRRVIDLVLSKVASKLASSLNFSLYKL